MATASATQAQDYEIADIALADFGRKEMDIAENVAPQSTFPFSPT